MVDDTFTFSVTNPSPAMFDIDMGTVKSMDDLYSDFLVENGTVIFDYTPVKLSAHVVNTGDLTGTKDVKIYNEALELLETIPLTLAGGANETVHFTNAGAGFALAEGVVTGFQFQTG